MRFVNRALWIGLFTAVIGLANLNATTFSRIEEMSGWKSCGNCTKLYGATYSMQQHVSSPSRDGDSTKFSVGGSSSGGAALWYRWMSSNSTATNFVYDLYYYMKTPGAAGAMEFSASQRSGYKWYRWDTQCLFTDIAVWRLWNNATGHWYRTSIPCKRPAPYTWTHLVWEGKKVNGKVLFVSLSVNGQKHYLNKTFDPKYMGSSDNSVKVHFQLNGNSQMTDYSAWGDQFKLTYW
jgi:hypothetical protein